jgi:hypothetical protein
MERIVSLLPKTTDSQQKVHLYVSLYPEKHPKRRHELQRALELNLQHPVVSHIYVVSELPPEDPIPEFLKASAKTTIISSSQRLTFSNFFQIANLYTDEQTLNILINSDIVLGTGFETLRLTEKQFICLSRYDPMDDTRFTLRVGGGSHDCWIWKGSIDASLGQFNMGKFLCDGVLAYQLKQSGYILKNPALDLKTYHLHMSDVRHYTWDDKIHGCRCGVRFSHNDNRFTDTDVYDDGYSGC